MAHGLTRFDIVQIRRTARELREDYDIGRYDGPSTVMLSEGYAEVDFDPDDEGMALLTRRGRTVGVRMKDGPSRVGAKRKAGRKTASRKKVPAKRVNPAMHLPPRPSDRASHVAWDSYMEKVDAMPVSFAGQPAYVRELWNLTAMGFGKVSSDGTVVEFARKYHPDVWRKHPALKGKSVARIRLHEEGMVTPMRSVKVSNPARKRAPKGR